MIYVFLYSEKHQILDKSTLKATYAKNYLQSNDESAKKPTTMLFFAVPFHIYFLGAREKSNENTNDQ